MSEATDPGGAGGDATLSKAALRGSAVTVIGQGLGTIIRFGANLIITRLLVPEHFGVMAIVNVFVMALYLFSDIGVGPNIIQSKRGDDPVFLNTAWTTQVVRGLILALIACACGWPMAWLYGIPELTLLVPVAGLTAILGGLESTKLFTVNRSLSFVRLTALELSTQLAGVLAMIAAGWWLRSVWALVVAAWVTSITKTVLSHALLPGPRNRLAWDRESRRSLFEFGRWIFVSTIFTFLAGQSDRLILGKLVTTVALGVYSIGANIAALPLQVINQVSSRVFFPVVAAAMRRADHDPAVIRRARVKLMLVLAPLLALAVAMAPPALTLLYDERYHRAGTVAAFLAIGSWFATISSSYGVVLLAMGRPKALSVANAAKLVSFASLLWLAAARYGIEGAALVVALSEVAFLVVAQLAARRERVVTVAADLGITCGVAALVGAYLGLHHLLLSQTGSRVVALAVPVAAALCLTAAMAKKVRLLSGGEAGK
ncbi:MAG: hypothetical protein A2138_20395, partial [Deltaproteobacteria bacterium RBG_16_71_12]